MKVQQREIARPSPGDEIRLWLGENASYQEVLYVKDVTDATVTADVKPGMTVKVWASRLKRISHPGYAYWVER